MPTDERFKRADQLFEAALELPVGERSAYLARACGDDGELRALVERLLANADTEEMDLVSGGGLGGSLWQDAARNFTAGTASVGMIVGRYCIVREIGRGGMAVVYLAERADGQFQQQVALKLIQRGFLNDELVRRFDQERQILARIHHPSIAQLYDGGVAGDGRPYLAMEYIEGRPIDLYCDEERLNVEARLKLFLDVARAVSHAHRNLVVHRDIKPSNILVSKDGHVKLLDFGIAKLLDSEAMPGETPVTRTDARLMTPLYASPEQIRGGPVTTASDVYQLGLLLYQLLAGRWPYRLTGRGPAELARVICEDVPTRPSTAIETSVSVGPESGRATAEEIGMARGISPPRLKRTLAGDLDNIVLMALRKEPERRYATVAQLIEDVERFLGGHPVAARGDSFLYRADKFFRRNRAAVITALGALALIVALAVYYTVELASERDRAQAEAAEADQVADFLRGLFEGAAPTRSKGEQVPVRQLLDRGARQIEEDLADQPELQAKLMAVMGGVYRELALYEEARQLLERAVELQRAGDDDLELAHSLYMLADVNRDEGRPAEAQSLYEQALALYEDLLGPEDADVGRTLSGLGAVLTLRGEYDEARRVHERALAILEAALDADAPEVGLALLRRGSMLKNVREYEAAKSDLERALAILEKSYDDDHLYVINVRIVLGEILDSTGEREAARASYALVLPALERTFGPEHPRVGDVLSRIAISWNYDDRPDKAIPNIERALDIYESALGPNNLRTALALNNLGYSYQKMGDYRTAQTYLERSLEALEVVHGPEHAAVATALGNVAENLANQGELEAALELYRRALLIREKSFGTEHSLLSPILVGIGGIELRMGEAAGAEATLRRALEVGRDEPATRHDEVVLPRIQLARSLVAQERFEEAEGVLLENLDEDGLDPADLAATHGDLAELYQLWGQTEKAARHRQARAALENADKG